jgi:putative ABC transport system substrate-binding protein
LQIVEFAATNRLPVMSGALGFTGAGGLISYTPDVLDMYRRAAGYVDRILRGAKPSDMPVEQPTKLLLVLNLKTARALGVTIPPSVLTRADQLIE